MAQSLQLGNPTAKGTHGSMQRVNRLPILIGIAVVLSFIAIVIVGLSWRGVPFLESSAPQTVPAAPATSFGERLKEGIGDGIIGDADQQPVLKPAPPATPSASPPPASRPLPVDRTVHRSAPEDDGEWKARLQREEDEQYLREAQRQRLARLQARASALDAPLAIEIAKPTGTDQTAHGAGNISAASARPDPYSGAVGAALAQQTDVKGQNGKEAFFNKDIKTLGYLPNQVTPPLSAYELKRGSVIPATLITGLNSDLPGRLIAQVSQNVYDSATGARLLVPQGARLFGRYDSKVSFGQSRALVVWTDLVFPDGSTLQIGAMAGTDAEGYGGFRDRVDRHYLRLFGSAALIAIIGTGIDMSMPQSSSLTMQDSASDAARRNFAESFGRVAERTISRNLDVQPTISIRPGYQFNILVDQDIVFPGAYRSR